MKDKLELIMGRLVVIRVPFGTKGAMAASIGELDRLGKDKYRVAPKLAGTIVEFPVESVAKVEVVNEIPVITLQ